MKIILIIGGLLALLTTFRMLPLWHYPWFKIVSNDGPFYIYLLNIAETLLVGFFVIFSIILIYNQQWQ